MSQNKSQIIEHFIGNLSNFIVHTILSKSFPVPELKEKYRKEFENSLERAKKYRSNMNPINRPLNILDSEYITEKLKKEVRNELNRRIILGYKNINLEIIDKEIENILKQLMI